MLDEIKRNTIDIALYSEEYWKEVQKTVYSDETNFGEFLINFFFNVKNETILEDDSKMCILILSSLYPIRENQIDMLTKSLVNLINELNQINQSELVNKRDHLLYYVMDILFHNPELVCDVSNIAQDLLLNSILKMSDLQYDETISYSESYYKNYKAIQFIDYFTNETKKISLISKYFNHFDSRLKDDIVFEMEEYDKFDYYKNKNC